VVGRFEYVHVEESGVVLDEERQFLFFRRLR
jgi:hypothetical protein